jgi:hypothetical protein
VEGLKVFKLTRITEAPVTNEEHARQRALVQLSCRLSDKRCERAQEAATQARLYSSQRERVENVVPLHPQPPQQAA